MRAAIVAGMMMAQEARAASQVNSVPEVTEAAAASEPVTKEIPATQEPELPTKETPFTQQPPQTSEGDSRTKKKLSPGDLPPPTPK